MAEYSFDIQATVELPEVDNAWQQALKEIGNRWDFKGKTAQLDWKRAEKQVVVTAQDRMVLEAILDIFHTRLAKRGVSVKALRLDKEEPASGGAIRQVYGLADGIPGDRAKEITKAIKASKLKVQASIQGDAVRVTGKNKDDLQSVQQLVRELDLPLPISFGNYR
jgi:cyclic-di-GMP-binding protein